MIAVTSPFKFAAPGPDRYPNPTRNRPQFAFFTLGFRLPELKLSAGRTDMEMLQRWRDSFWRTSRGGNLAVEPDSDGEDFFSTAEGDENPEHLVVMVNGINGSAADWTYGAEQFVKKLPDKVFVHCSKCNYARLTFQGVDKMGERLAEEVLNVVKNQCELQKISFVAHSLGGLVARYAIGKLYESVPKLEPSSHNGDRLNEEDTHNLSQCHKQTHQGTIAGLEPMNFVTVATPHLGSKGHKQLPFLCGLPFLERRATETAHWIVGRSGKHLFLTDADRDKPLLLRMVNDTDDLKFISALRVFKRRVAYANANYDHMVGWRTSSIRRPSELPKSNQLVSDKKYPHIVYVERERFNDIHNRVPSNLGEQRDELEEEMIKGLTQVPWERVDVSFQKSRQRFIAHSTIQVKRYWLNSDGADVVYHIIDNFLL
ncbi:hypothetical protein UlMin_004268 [Ulmus minor]